MKIDKYESSVYRCNVWLRNEREITLSQCHDLYTGTDFPQLNHSLASLSALFSFDMAGQQSVCGDLT